jgi:hypothetical protein
MRVERAWPEGEAYERWEAVMNREPLEEREEQERLRREYEAVERVRAFVVPVGDRVLLVTAQDLKFLRSLRVKW